MSSSPNSTESGRKATLKELQRLARALEALSEALFAAEDSLTLLRDTHTSCGFCGGEGQLHTRCSCSYSPFCGHCDGSGVINEPCPECGADYPKAA